MTSYRKIPTEGDKVLILDHNDEWQEAKVHYTLAVQFLAVHGKDKHKRWSYHFYVDFGNTWKETD